MRDFNEISRRTGPRFVKALGGQPVVYYSDYNDHVAGGTRVGVTVLAIVRYTLPEIAHGSPNVAPSIELTVPNDARYGVTSVVPKRDKVLLPRQVGGVPELLAVTAIVRQDEGMWMLRVW